MQQVRKDSLRLYPPKKRRVKVEWYAGYCGVCNGILVTDKDGHCADCGERLKQWLGGNEKMDDEWSSRGGGSDEEWIKFMRQKGARVYVR